MSKKNKLQDALGNRSGVFSRLKQFAFMVVPDCFIRRGVKPSRLKGFQLGDLGTIYAGRYVDKPDFLPGIKLAPEVPGDAHTVIPIVDFGVPGKTDIIEGIIRVISLLLAEQAVYVGCAGGLGRTGLFLGCLLKCFEDDESTDPVVKVRTEYDERAIETRDQEAFVRNFDADTLKILIRMIESGNAEKVRG